MAKQPERTGWRDDDKLMKFEQAKKEKRQVMTQAIIAMVLGATLYLVGWWLVSLPAFLIALGLPIAAFGGVAFYGQVISEVSLNSNGGDRSAQED